MAFDHHVSPNASLVGGWCHEVSVFLGYSCVLIGSPRHNRLNPEVTRFRWCQPGVFDLCPGKPRFSRRLASPAGPEHVANFCKGMRHFQHWVTKLLLSVTTTLVLILDTESAEMGHSNGRWYESIRYRWSLWQPDQICDSGLWEWTNCLGLAGEFCYRAWLPAPLRPLANAGWQRTNRSSPTKDWTWRFFLGNWKLSRILNFSLIASSLFLEVQL